MPRILSNLLVYRVILHRMRCQAFHPFEIQPAETRLILALVLSLALHVALALLVQVKSAYRFDLRAKVLHVNLTKRPPSDSLQADKMPASSQRQDPEPSAARKQTDAASALHYRLPSEPALSPSAPVLGMSLSLPPSLPEAETHPTKALADLTAPAMLLPQSPLPAVDIPVIEDPVYYTAKQVDIHPAAVHPIEPDYPEAAATAGLEGYVTLRLLIDATGVVREISVVDAQPPDTFEAAALNAFRNARFLAARRNDRPVKSNVLIRVTFETSAGSQRPEAKN